MLEHACRPVFGPYGQKYICLIYSWALNFYFIHAKGGSDHDFQNYIKNYSQVRHEHIKSTPRVRCAMGIHRIVANWALT